MSTLGHLHLEVCERKTPSNPEVQRFKSQRWQNKQVFCCCKKKIVNALFQLSNEVFKLQHLLFVLKKVKIPKDAYHSMYLLNQ
jgi:hypothetical protein